jgi:hypothetical protein
VPAASMRCSGGEQMLAEAAACPGVREVVLRLGVGAPCARVVPSAGHVRNAYQWGQLARRQASSIRILLRGARPLLFSVAFLRFPAAGQVGGGACEGGQLRRMGVLTFVHASHSGTKHAAGMLVLVVGYLRGAGLEDGLPALHQASSLDALP